MKIKHLVLAGLGLAFGFVSLNVQAVPAFARKTGIACSGCHYAVPALSSLGRMFKMNGYRLSASQKPARKFNDYLNLDKSFPMAAGIVSRPFDKTKGNDATIHAAQDIMLWVAGSFGDKWSGFMEFGGGVEADFAVEAEHGQITYSMSPKLNIQVAKGPTFWSDPYDTLTHMRRLTVAASSIIESQFGGADAGLGENRQQININGRIDNRLFYSLGYAGLGGNADGKDPQTLIGRVAFDVTPNVMLGAFTVDGTCTVASGSLACLSVDRNYSRTGVDFQADHNNWRFTGVYLKAKDDDVLGLTQETNKAYTGRVVYTFRKDGRPTFVPYLQIDNHEQFNGAESITDTTAGLTYYEEENIKATIEYTNTAGDGTTPDDNRTVLQLAAYF